MNVSVATKYRNPMPFEDLDPYDYFSPAGAEGVIYRRLDDGRAIQVTDKASWSYQMPPTAPWSNGVFKVVITKMEYKEL